MTPLIENARALVHGAALKATQYFINEYNALPNTLDTSSSSQEIREKLLQASWPEMAEFQYQQRVEIWWKDTWFPATTIAAHSNGSYYVKFDQGGSWGSGACVYPNYIRNLGGNDNLNKPNLRLHAASLDWGIHQSLAWTLSTGISHWYSRLNFCIWDARLLTGSALACALVSVYGLRSRRRA